MPQPGPVERYRALTDAGKLEADPAQLAVCEQLESRYRALLGAERRWFRRHKAVPGLYLHGRVGRGKTLLMDLFAASLEAAGASVRRSHFNRFMDRIHGRLREIGVGRDPLRRLAGDIADESRVLCFDEFHVDDIGDAMILGELLGGLFDRGVTLVATSNTAPDDLYAGGLQRVRFELAIERIKAHCEVVELDAREDFRLRELERHPVYYSPDDEASERAMAGEFESLTPGEPTSTGPLRVRGREIPVRGHAGSVAWFDFSALCEGPRSTADYIDLSRRFSTLMLSHVPRMGEADNNAARRFVHLVDECYDRAVKLVLSAAVPATGLYDGQRLADIFQRTESRLIEMQSREYLARPHRP